MTSAEDFVRLLPRATLPTPVRSTQLTGPSGDPLSQFGRLLTQALASLAALDRVPALEHLQDLRSLPAAYQRPTTHLVESLVSALREGKVYRRAGDSPIFVEGISGVGKSHLCRHLMDSFGLPYSPEAALLAEGPTIPDGRALEESIAVAGFFLAVESIRTHHRCPVHDRSWLGHLAYAWAYEQSSGQRGFYAAVRQLAVQGATDGRLAIPSVVVVVTANEDVRVQRLLDRTGHSGVAAGSPLWLDGPFVALVADWYERLAEHPEARVWMMENPGIYSVGQSGPLAEAIDRAIGQGWVLSTTQGPGI